MAEEGEAAVEEIRTSSNLGVAALAPAVVEVSATEEEEDAEDAEDAEGVEVVVAAAAAAAAALLVL